MKSERIMKTAEPGKARNPGKADSAAKKKTDPRRMRAEALVKKRFGKIKLGALSDKETQRLVHELQTHQIELEIQNEELRNSQIALEEAREKYSDLYHFAPVGYFTFDRNGIVVEANLTSASLLGIDRKRLIGSPFAYFLRSRAGNSDSRSIFNVNIGSVLKTGKRQTCELELTRNDGTKFFAYLESVPSDGGMIRTAMSDVTDRKKAEKALLKEKALSDSTIESLPGIFYLLDQEGGLLRWNSNVLLVTGYTADELPKMRPPDFFAGKDKQLIAQKMQEAFTKGSSTAEAELVSKDGRKTPYFFTALRVTIDDRECLVGTGLDIADRRRAEEALRLRTVELEAANEELEAFSYAISHDLKSPLRSIAGFTDILKEDYSDRLDDTARDYLRRVNAASKKMAELIDAILTMSIQTKGKLSKTTVDLSQLAKLVADEIKEKEPRRKVEFVIADGIKVEGDRVMLELVIRNLLQNAWKFTSKHESARIEFGVTHEGAGTIYYVKDDGAGFIMEHADRLFMPFMRLHHESEFSGLGIGLSTAHRIISRHGGRMWAEGKPDKGATFYFSLG